MKAYNFNAGPCVLPKQAVFQAYQKTQRGDEKRGCGGF